MLHNINRQFIRFSCYFYFSGFFGVDKMTAHASADAASVAA